MQEENLNQIHQSDKFKNKNFSIKFDDCSNKDKEKLVIKTFNSLPLFYYVSEIGQNATAQSVMECPMRQPTTNGASYYHHYHHINDQTKSLQELQHEVGELLEFRNLVIETFPDLKNKMASISASHTLTGNSGTNSPFTSRLEWEPGIRTKRKLIQLKDSTPIYVESAVNANASNSGQNHIEMPSSLTRSRSNSNSGKKESKNAESNGSVVIQDSGFSTETSSSKEAHSASSTSGALQGVVLQQRYPVIELDDELLNLLDVIHRKSNKIKEEIESLQTNKKSKIFTCEKYLGTENLDSTHQSNITSNKGCVNHKSFNEYVTKLGKGGKSLLQKERDDLLNKLADMEAESVTKNIRINKMQEEIEELNKIRKDLQNNLNYILDQNSCFRDRISEEKHQSGLVNDSLSQKSKSNFLQITSTPLISTSSNSFSKNFIAKNRAYDELNDKSPVPKIINLPLDDEENSKTQFSTNSNRKLLLNTFHNESGSSNRYITLNLGHLDGLISEPSFLPKHNAIDSKKVSAILRETNVIELQRHLLNLTVQNQVLMQKLEQTQKIQDNIIKKFEISKGDIADIQFQLDERNFEIRGNRAQSSILNSDFTTSEYKEKFRTPLSKNFKDSDITLDVKQSPGSSEHMFENEDLCKQVSTPSMKAMIPIALDDIGQNNSNSSGLTQDNNETASSTGDNFNLFLQTNEFSPREKPRPPSRIPLPGNKIGNASPKPPTGRMSVSVINSKPIISANSSSSKYLCRSTGNLYGKSQNGVFRPSSAQSLRKENSLSNTSRNSSSSIPVSSSGQNGSYSHTNNNYNNNMSSQSNQVKQNPSQFKNQNKQNQNNSLKFVNSPLVKHKREHMSSSRARNLDSLSKNQNNNNINILSSSAPGRSINNSNNINSKVNNDKHFLSDYSSTNFHRLHSNSKKDSSFTFAQTDNNNMSSKTSKQIKTNISTNVRRVSNASRNTSTSNLTDLHRQQSQQSQSHQKTLGQYPLIQANSQNNDENGKVRNLRSTVLGWLKF